MSKRTTVLLGLAVGLVLFFAVNVLAGAALRGWRLDLTEANLYTLSEGSERIARSLDEPLRMRFYFSEDVADEIPPVRDYGRRVREFLEEYEHASGGKIELEVLDPEPFSEAEDEAIQAGLQPYTGAPLKPFQKLYLGLVVSNSVGEREVVPFFSESRERFLEYDLTQLVHSLSTEERPVVGLLTSLPMQGSFDPRNPQQRADPWVVVQQLRGLFDVRALTAGFDEVPEDVDVLLVVHPKDLPDETRYAIDQYVLAGGEAIVMVDPHCEVDPAGQDPANPMAGLGADRGSALPELFEAWGLELVPNRVAADRANALQTRGSEWPLVHWFRVGPEGMDDEDPITSLLSSLHVASPGILRPLPDAETTFEPLVRTSEDAMDLDLGSVQFRTPPQELLSRFVPRHERYTLAARVSGPARSAFPDGPPGTASDEGADEEATEDEPTGTDGDGEEDEADGASDHLAASEGPIQVVVVADCDLLADFLWLRPDYLFGAMLKTAENGDLVLNAVENLGGGEDLISIRARGAFQRPFTVVEEIAADARQRYLSREQELRQRQREAESRINELLQQQDPAQGSVLLTPEIEEELDRWQEELVATNAELRDVQHKLVQDIERLGTRLRWLNIALLPGLVALAALGLGAWRVRRRRRSDR